MSEDKQSNSLTCQSVCPVSLRTAFL